MMRTGRSGNIIATATITYSAGSTSTSNQTITISALTAITTLFHEIVFTTNSASQVSADIRPVITISGSTYYGDINASISIPASQSVRGLTISSKAEYFSGLFNNAGLAFNVKPVTNITSSTTINILVQEMESTFPGKSLDFTNMHDSFSNIINGAQMLDNINGYLSNLSSNSTPAGSQANAWSASATVSSGATSNSIDLQYVPNISYFGTVDTTCVLTFEVSQNNSAFYTLETKSITAAGSFCYSTTLAARYVRLTIDTTATITATIAGK